MQSSAEDGQYAGPSVTGQGEPTNKSDRIGKFNLSHSSYLVMHCPIIGTCNLYGKSHRPDRIDAVVVHDGRRLNAAL